MNATRRLGALVGQATDLRLPIMGVGAVGLAVALFLYLGFPILFLPLALAGLALGMVTLLTPSLSLCLVVAAIYVPTNLGGITILQIVGTFVGVLSMFWYALSKRGFTFPMAILPVIGLILHTLISLNFTHDMALSEFVVRKLSLNALFTLLLVNLIDDYRKLRQFLMTFMIMGALNAIAGIVQFGSGAAPESRAQGLQENQIQLGEVAAVAFVIPFYFSLYADRRWKQSFWLLLSVLIASGIVTSVSRGAFIAFSIGLLTILIQERRYWKRFLVFGVVILGLLPLIPNVFYERFTNLGQQVKTTIIFSGQKKLSSRGYFNKAAIRIWKAHPILGVGICNYGFYFVQPEFNPGIRGGKNLPPHNVYAQALAETGIVGTLMVAGWILIAIMDYRSADVRARDDPQNRLLLRSCEAITLITLITYFSQGNLLYTHLSLVMVLGSVCRRCAETQAAVALPPSN